MYLGRYGLVSQLWGRIHPSFKGRIDKRRNKIGIIIDQYLFFIQSSLINSAVELARAGYSVYIFINKEQSENIPAIFSDYNIKIIFIDIAKELNEKYTPDKEQDSASKILICKELWDSHVQAWMEGYCEHAVKFFSSLYFTRLYLFYKLSSQYIDDSFVCLMGVESYGLIIASMLGFDHRIPFIYYNLELLLKEDIGSPYNVYISGFPIKCQVLYKELEEECSRRSYFTIVADERRASYLMKDNHILPDKVLCIPVGSTGAPYRNKSSFLREKLGIDPGKKIMLFVGTIFDGMMCLELARSAQSWNDDKVLVLHSRERFSDDNPYINQIRGLTSTGKVYLSTDPVPWDMLHTLISSGDIGLVFYKNLSRNFYETSRSSNKTALFLQAGLPIITIDFPGFQELIDQYHCGKYTGNTDEVEHLADDILSNYSTYRENAFRCFTSEYEFSGHFRSVLDRVEQLSQGA